MKGLEKIPDVGRSVLLEGAMDSAKVNYQDIDLILKLYELRREATMLQARSYVGGSSRRSQPRRWSRSAICGRIGAEK